MPTVKFPCGHHEQISMESYLYLVSTEQPKPPRKLYCNKCRKIETITFVPTHITRLDQR